MIDVIIPIYKYQDSILKTLFSIGMQTIKDNIKVHLIVNANDEKSENLKVIFEDKLDICIEYFEIVKNRGINIFKNPYILFLGSDIRIHHGYSLEVLLNSIEDNDIIYGMTVSETDDGTLVYNNEIQNCFYSRLYKRKFLKKNDIKFKDEINIEKNYFNFLKDLSTENKTYVDEYIIFDKFYNE